MGGLSRHNIGTENREIVFASGGMVQRLNQGGRCGFWRHCCHEPCRLALQSSVDHTNADDEYSMIVNTFGDAFVREYSKRERLPEWSFLRSAELFSTGHSLGGGLAEEFAYSLPSSEDVPRVKKVFAFDPTPVTGFLSVGKDLRDENKEGLAIDRIYERGEILAIVRSFTNFVHVPPARSPEVRQIRYNLFHTWNVIKGHSIPELACELNEASQE